MKNTDTPVEAYVITPEQLRERDERIIRATVGHVGDEVALAMVQRPGIIDAIIAQADEVDQ